MGGLEEIIRQIDKEAGAEASAILSDAERECEKIKKNGETETARLLEEKTRQSDRAVRVALEKMRSGADMRQKQDILRVKQNIISDILKKAREKLHNLPAEEYFDALIKIAAKNAHKEHGVIALCERDLKRMPEDFPERLKAAGLDLEVSSAPGNVDDGLILEYGDIEENCSFASLIRTQKDSLQDQLNRYIFDRREDANV